MIAELMSKDSLQLECEDISGNFKSLSISNPLKNLIKVVDP